MNPALSSACQISDGYIKVPRVTHKDYLIILKEYCKEKNISIDSMLVISSNSSINKQKDARIKATAVLIYNIKNDLEKLKPFQIKAFNEKLSLDSLIEVYAYNSVLN